MDTNLSQHFSYDDTIIRKVEVADIETLVGIINDAYSYQDEATGAPRTNVGHLTKKIGETDFYVVEKTDKIVSCVYLEPDGNSLHFGLLTVIAELRGAGLAPVIIEAIISYASYMSYSFIEMDYMSVAPWLKKYYEKYGFKETGEKAEWGSIDLVRMRRDVLRG